DYDPRRRFEEGKLRHVPASTLARATRVGLARDGPLKNLQHARARGAEPASKSTNESECAWHTRCTEARHADQSTHGRRAARAARPWRAGGDRRLPQPRVLGE